MNVKFRSRNPKASHIQYVHSSGDRGKITQTPYHLALKGHICLFSLEAWENFQASKLAMQISSNLLKRGC